MRAVIASDSQTVSTKLRHAVIQLGYECLVADVLAVEDAARVLATTDRQPDLLLVVLTDDEDRCLSHLRRFSESAPARIIAVGPGDDPQRILSAVHAGADDYLVDGQDLYQQLSSFVSRLTAKRETAAHNGRLTIVASVGGGSGASVVAGNLAALIAAEKESCGLLDLDAHSADQAALFNLKPRHTLAELCHTIDGCDQNMLKQSLTRHESGVMLLAGPQRPSDQQHVTAEGIRRVTRIARSVLPQVVADFGSVLDGGDVDLLKTADEILIVFRSDFVSLRRLRAVLEIWDEAQIGRGTLLANSCGQSKQLPVTKIQAALRREVLLTLPDDRAGLNVSVDEGTPLVLKSPQSPFSKAMRQAGVLTGLLPDAATPFRHATPALVQALLSKLATLTRGVFDPLMARAPR